ncbi:hypothetical protein ACSTJO_00485, partial [Vibrio parahaemolyticus]
LRRCRSENRNATRQDQPARPNHHNTERNAGDTQEERHDENRRNDIVGVGSQNTKDHATEAALEKPDQQQIQRR